MTLFIRAIPLLCRLEYAKQLMRHIPVHSYGACLHNQDFPEDASRDFSIRAFATK